MGLTFWTWGRYINYVSLARGQDGLFIWNGSFTRSVENIDILVILYKFADLRSYSPSGEMDLEEGEVILNGHSTSDATFDMTVGHIEDIIMDNNFRKLQTEFMNKYYQTFENTEENKLEYMDIFREYNSLIEKYLEQQLRNRIQNFSMEEFTKQLILRRSELDGEVFEILLTFSDFFAFKEMFLDYKAEKEGTNIDLSGGLSVTSVSHNSAL